jgi:membrane AbrB-like protein
MLFYRRLRGWDAATALFASLPGALGLVVLLAAETRADMRRVTIAQSIRLFLLVVALPFVITNLSRPAAAAAPLVISSLPQLFILLGSGTVAGLALDRLKVPAGLILGPTIAGAALELTGLVQGGAPLWLLVPANIILGIMMAVRFQGFALTDLAAAFGEGFIGFAIALAIALAEAGLATVAAGLPLALTLLAFSPGGLDAMLIIAFALDLDPAYVGAHQIARYIGLVIAMPWVTHALLRRTGEPAE